MNTIIYLTLDQVVDLHNEAIQLDGGLDGIRSYDALASAVGQVEASVYGEDAYPSIADKAAAYGFFLTMNHPFIEGNKRTATLAMLTFLAVNGYELNQDDDQIEDMIVELADNQIDQPQFFAWVATYVRLSDSATVVPFKSA
jgi:death on curing protein